ncbi:hypothetical protein BGZ52_009841, partial [Haplosporangium bisporale]
IKNKITKMKGPFNAALLQKNQSGFGSTDDTSWHTIIDDICPYFFILEEGWTTYWKEAKHIPVNTLENTDEPFVVDSPVRGTRPSGEDNYDEGVEEGVEEGAQDEDEEEEEILERRRPPQRSTPTATPTATPAAIPSQSQSTTSTNAKHARGSLLKDLQGLYETTQKDIEAIKAERELEELRLKSQMQQRQMEHEREKMEHERKLAFMANEKMEHERKMALIRAEQEDQQRILKKREMELTTYESRLRIAQLEYFLKEKGLTIPGRTPSPKPRSPSVD